MIYRPLNAREIRFLHNSEAMPPFVEERNIEKSDIDYEDTIYSMLRVALLRYQSNDTVASLTQGMIMHESLGPFSNLPDTILSLDFSGKPIAQNDLARFIISQFRDDKDGHYSDSTDNELWLCYNDSSDKVRRSLIAATAKLSKIHLPRSYNDSITEYRGVIPVGEPVNRTIPVYLWPDASLDLDVLIHLTGKEKAMAIHLPEGYSRGTWSRDEVTHEVFEKAVLRQMIQWPEEKLPEGIEYEPNGETTFPDFAVTSWDLFPEANIAIEITRLFDYQARMIDTVRHGELADSFDQRLNSLSENSRWSENEIRESIEKAIRRKAARGGQLSTDQKYMLILVSNILPLEAEFRVFQSQDYSAFDYVVLANQIGDLNFAFQTIKE
ncbi:MAG: hypothetical protein F4X57_03710 [Chloroflexi bacterium]|nr:hypothetical protein [Chloroflexota bacterium]